MTVWVCFYRFCEDVQVEGVASSLEIAAQWLKERHYSLAEKKVAGRFCDNKEYFFQEETVDMFMDYNQ